MRLWICALMVGWSGCSQEEPKPSIVMVDFETPDVRAPSETWVDKASGLMFTTPGPGWRRLEASAIAGFADAKLGVRYDERCWGYVLARPANGMGARAAADASRGRVAWEELSVLVDEDVRYDLWTARRYEVTGMAEGEQRSERATFWLEFGNVYGVVAMTSERGYMARRRCLDAVTAGFALGMPSP